MKIFNNVNKEASNELEQLDLKLKTLINNLRDERDVEKIREVIKQIEEIEPIKINVSAEDYLDKFKNEILPEAINVKNELSKLQTNDKKNTYNKNRKPLFRVTFYRIAFSLIATITILNFCTISFAGFNIFEPVITWTNKVFNKSITYKESIGDNEDIINTDTVKIFNDYESVENEFNVKLYKPKSNKYVPDEFVVSDLSTIAYVSVLYLENDFEINYLITITKSKNQSYEQSIEKTNDEVEIYKKDGIDFYIIKNIDWYVVTWCDKNIDYVASGFRTNKEARSFAEDLTK